MVSLSTVYGVSIVLGSLAAMGAAYVGTKVYPIQTGGDPLAGATALAATVTGAFAAAQKALEPSPEPLATETVKEEPVQQEKDESINKSNIELKPIYDGGKLPVYNPPSNEHDKTVYVEDVPPTSFFENQQKFINSLSEDEKIILKSYTWAGDKVINYYLRNLENKQPVSSSMLMSLFSEMKKEYPTEVLVKLFGGDINQVSEENVDSYIRKYILNFIDIFNKSPKVDTSFTVFRGTRQEISNHVGFKSTTFNPFSAALFEVFTAESCCLYELTILPGTRVLLMDLISDLKNEREILISPSSTVNISKTTTKELWIINTSSEVEKKKSISVFEGTISPRTEIQVQEAPVEEQQPSEVGGVKRRRA